VRRWEVEREVVEFESSLGPAAAKVKRLPDEPPGVALEYEACKRLAESSGLPLAEVYRIVQAEGGPGLLGERTGNLGPRTSGFGRLDHHRASDVVVKSTLLAGERYHQEPYAQGDC
jgi:hypothetical protein